MCFEKKFTQSGYKQFTLTATLERFSSLHFTSSSLRSPLVYSQLTIMAHSQKLALGIDLGTTSVKVVVVSTETKQIVSKQSKDTQANVPSDLGVEGNKQDVPKILSAVHSCVSRIPKDLLRQVVNIGICGQMHGVTFWKYSSEEDDKEHDGVFKLEISREKVSPLYTWQDSRCDPKFLASLPASKSHLTTHSGYGCATIFWFAKYKPEKLSKYNRCGTVQDLLVALLCGHSEVTISTQNAASWGYFLTTESRWEIDVLSQHEFPTHILPSKILQPGQAAGCLEQTWFGIPAGTPVGVALGDLQCSVYALLKDPTDAVLNISTSAQLAYVDPFFSPKQSGETAKIQHFPYFEGRYLAVAASLNGGNSLATFVRALQQWSMDLGFSIPQSKVWEKLIALGQEDTAISDLEIVPTLLGERHAPEHTASVSQITLDTLQLGQIFRALCSGVIKNLHNMMPQEVLQKAGIQQIVGNGSGLVRNLVLQKEVLRWYQLPLEIGQSGDAALGSALAVINHN
ncbi:sedoheptulokinase-like isoform X1 [Neodiprion pinetum]|uniref:sedoheptulokinase-like isoform X1 n=3 Tax=Neodiprion fabricii TaxID=2872261 RepID=UPI001ED8D22A|nr:sedoheptulokinase-like isoform X1 [Neodiprion fabricii]XP_046423724.1 sedoheptulokinase-like isoform X1 [Neodiprion fabricii]XP_046423725.1 sedoheptulokinase-like isoform X1 [Neodiprion fabricii]XP_046423726.1 sedoheptulokinase-like isoform X1 [Neodiprion fabricii]XP_046423727.1 sedoheptulokinase-like isoform X1 [Neodiprion fabricii]XP_046479166.1 sedoheptulokinase-like isoform X1 [Neodiprion pinetum]XP_046479167.1 sedoheptulokinase-like isoform X1 [Neodiprion pinetum]XP_046479169.1 sedoh